MVATARSAEELVLGLAAAARAAGLAVTADRARTCVAAVAEAGLDDRTATYWAGRATLCAGPADLPVYEAVFAAWFDPAGHPRRGLLPVPPRTTPRADVRAAPAPPGDEPPTGLADAREVLRTRDVADLDDAGRARVAAMLAALPAGPPLRTGGRRAPGRRGAVDLGRTLREQLRRGGEPVPLRRRRARPRPRRVVWLVDVSGSMAPYADTLLRLAHRSARGCPGTEVFTLGTRLTRVTPAMTTADPETALAVAGRTVPDWSGGTRLGDTLGAFLDRWGRRGVARGAVVVVCSDGWERGDPADLARRAAELGRLAHRVVWSNPHRGREGYEPSQGGIAAVLPHVDAHVAGHSPEAFEALLAEVRDGTRATRRHPAVVAGSTDA